MFKKVSVQCIGRIVSDVRPKLIQKNILVMYPEWKNGEYDYFGKNGTFHLDY